MSPHTRQPSANPRPRPRAALAGALLVPAFLAALLAAPAPAALAVTSPWQENEQSRVRLVSPWEIAPAGEEMVLGLEFETIPDWHVYWKNSGDAGYPPFLDFGPTPEITGSEILWPAPERYHLPGDLVALGYEGHVVYPVRVTLDPEAVSAGGALPIIAELDYLVCEVDCIPYSYTLRLGQPLAATDGDAVADEELTELLETWQARVPRPLAEVDGVTTAGVVDLSQPESPALVVRFTGFTPEVGYEPELFLEASEVFNAGVPVRVDEAPEVEGGGAPELRFRVPLTFRESPEALPTTADFAWTLTGAVGPAGETIPVEARRSVEATTDVAAFAADADATDIPPAGRPGAPLGLAGTLFWAFVGGLLLHLTPTVLPLSVLRLTTLVSEPHPGRGATLTALGIASGGLGLLAWAAGGPTATWGQHLQSPLPVTALALLATLVALHLWGLLRLPLAAPNQDGEGAGTAAASRTAAAFFTGAAIFALALVWDLPPLARSLGPALAGAGGDALAFASVFAMVAGLAAPILLLALLPAARRLLAPLATGPLASRVASRAAQGLGFLEVGSVLWLLYLLSRQISGEGIAYVQLALLAVAMVAWLRHTARRRAVAAILAAVLLVLAVAVLWLAVDQRLDTAGAPETPLTETPPTETSLTPTPPSLS